MRYYTKCRTPNRRAAVEIEFLIRCRVLSCPRGSLAGSVGSFFIDWYLNESRFGFDLFKITYILRIYILCYVNYHNFPLDVVVFVYQNLVTP